MTHHEAIRNLTPKHLENFLDQVYLTGYNTGYQSVIEPDIFDDNPFDMEWLNRDVESFSALVEDNAGERLIIDPLVDIVMHIAEFKEEHIPDDICWEPKIVIPTEKTYIPADADIMVCEPVNEYGVSEDFEGDFDSWVAKGKPDDKRILLGTTSLALQSIGIADSKIVWNTSKINIIQRDHPDMNDSVIRQVPNIIGNPVIVMESISRGNRVIVYGEVYNDKGVPVLAALELLPSGRRSRVLLDTIRVASAYAKDSIANTQNLINNSNILYICPDKKRTDTWFSRNQLQLPFGITKYGSIGIVTYSERDVNGNLVFSDSEEPVPEWKAKLKELERVEI